MPPKASQSAVSALALQAAVAAAPSPPRLAGDAMGQAGSRDTLTQLTRAMAELKAIAVQPLLDRAVDAIRAEDWTAAGDWIQQALEKDERSGFGWYLMAIVRERLGDFASSIKAYEAALALIPEHAEVANDLGRLAYRMDMKSQAEKLFRHYLAHRPGAEEAVNNLACAVRDQRRFDEAVEILRPAILKNPQAPLLWNTMGTIVAEQGDYPNALTFFAEALRLDPDFYKSRYNLGNARLILGDPDGALEACEAALEQVRSEDERQMMRLSRSTILIAMGRLGDGWDEYEARLHPQFSDTTHFLFDLPRWEPGMDLKGKSLLVSGEQGLGDEILFGTVLPDVVRRLGDEALLTLAVEPRLVPLFQRSFPRARVVAHATYNVGGKTVRYAPELVGRLEGLDLWTPVGCLLRELRRSVADYPSQGPLLRADPARVAHWREALKAAPEGPKIGLLWKSAIDKDARHRFFSPFERWAPALKVAGATFVNLQYGDCSEELALAERDLGVRIWTPPGIDLKQDLDDIAALCSAMDLLLGFSNATLNISAACGAPTWLITTPGAWPRLGTKDQYPWYPDVRVFAAESFGAWEPVFDAVGSALGDWVAGR